MAVRRNRNAIEWRTPATHRQANRYPRKLSVYGARAGHELVDELAYLSARAMEPNVFFNPSFLAPAMPRIEDSDVRFAVMRDGHQGDDRIRLVLPFTIEPAPTGLGSSVMRAWAHDYGLLGTPLIDPDDPAGVLDDFLAITRRAHLGLPNVLVVPDIRLDGPFATAVRDLAKARNLPLHIHAKVERPVLQSHLSAEDYFRHAVRPHHMREHRRLMRRLGELGQVDYSVARTQAAIRTEMENFLALEAAGWKGKSRTAMSIDRNVAAFARESVHLLAERGLCRIHTLKLDGRTIASLIVFIEEGIAYTWKTAFDENFSAYSPGTLLMIETTRELLADQTVWLTDSCAIPNHPVMSRLWAERQEMGTLIIGTSAGAERAVRHVAAQYDLYREARDLAKAVRDRVKKKVSRPRATGKGARPAE